jgi:alkylation response protein AidB-like acyl-CoA dehydrogenase
MSASFDLDQDEKLLADSAERALAAVAPLHALASESVDVDAMVERHASLLRELGWSAMRVPEARGGAGAALAAGAIVAEAMGRHLGCAPFLVHAALLPALAQKFGGDWDKALDRLASDELRVALATGRFRFEGATLINGEALIIERGRGATHILALALEWHDADRVQLTAALIAANAKGMERRTRQAFDPSCPIETLRVVAAPCDARLDVALDGAALDSLLAPVHVTIAAELLGVADAALSRAVAHAKDREQFSQPIGRFQAIKHRLADAYVLVDGARLAVRRAALSGECDDALVARLAAGEAAARVTGDLVQIRGGLGFSWEDDAHLYMKRARRLIAMLDVPQRLRARLVARAV